MLDALLRGNLHEYVLLFDGTSFRMTEPPQASEPEGRLWTWIAVGVGSGALIGGVALGIAGSNEVESHDRGLPTESVRERARFARVVFSVRVRRRTIWRTRRTTHRWKTDEWSCATIVTTTATAS